MFETLMIDGSDDWSASSPGSRTPFEPSCVTAVVVLSICQQSVGVLRQHHLAVTEAASLEIASNGSRYVDAGDGRLFRRENSRAIAFNQEPDDQLRKILAVTHAPSRISNEVSAVTTEQFHRRRA